MKARWIILLLAGVAVHAACTMPDPGPIVFEPGSNRASTAATPPTNILEPHLPKDGFATLNNPADAHEELCTADSDHPNFPDDPDAITRTFCQDKKPGGAMPKPTGLADLLKQLNLDFKDPKGGNGVGGNPAFAILGHSSALTARKVSTLMPTAFIFTPPPADGSKPKGYSVVAFDPGEQFVEVASHDATVDNVNFYIVLFDQACNQAPGGCTNNDLLTNKLTTGWTNVRVYEDTTSLGNTIFDCHVCHQPNNDGIPFLRMQEIEAPFTHWMSANTEGGQALFADFHAAHGTEDYGGIPGTLIDKADPAKLAALVRQAGFGNQPNRFPSATIEAELKASAAQQPRVNMPAGTSPTWQALYDAAASGQFIPPPYHDVKVTDPTKLQAMTTAYQQYKAGSLAQLPNILDVFLDPMLRDMGFAPKAQMPGRGLVVQMCQMCHQSGLDMTQSRQHFLVDELDSMSREEKDLAIDRIKAPIDSRLTMPPPLFRTLSDDERQRMIDELSK